VSKEKEKGVVSFYQIMLNLSPIAEPHPKFTQVGAISHFLSLNMLEGRSLPLKFTIDCFRMPYLPQIAGH